MLITIKTLELKKIRTFIKVKKTNIKIKETKNSNLLKQLKNLRIKEICLEEIQIKLTEIIELASIKIQTMTLKQVKGLSLPQKILNWQEIIQASILLNQTFQCKMKKSQAFPIRVNKDNLQLKRKILKEKIKMFSQLDMPLTRFSKVHQRNIFNRKLKPKIFLSKRKKAVQKMNGTKFPNLFTIKNTRKIMSKIKKDIRNKMEMPKMNFITLKIILIKSKIYPIIFTIKISKINIHRDK